MFTKNIFVSIITFAIALSAFSQNKKDEEGRKQGFWEKRDPKGVLVYKGSFVNDKPAGKFYYYYESGKLKSTTTFSENGNVARSIFYHPNEKKMSEGKYIKELKDSIWNFYNAEGKIVSTESYINGKKNGVEKSFFNDGTVAEEKNWKNGVEDGVWKQYYLGGQVKTNAKYLAGFLDGKALYYYENGKIYLEAIYQHAVPNGEWIYYAEDGKVKEKVKYVNGKRQGEEPYEKLEDVKKQIDNPENQEIDKMIKEQWVQPK